jgi:hypothetical protein
MASGSHKRKEAIFAAVFMVSICKGIVNKLYHVPFDNDRCETNINQEHF